MFSYFKKSEKKIYYARFIFSAMSRVKLIAETRVYNMPQKHEIYGYFFFYSVSNVFAENTN